MYQGFRELILGLGGIGKTDLSLQLAKDIQEEFEFVIWRSLLNAPPESIKLQPNRPTRVWIIPRHEEEAGQVLETDSCFVFHHANAFL